MSAAFEGVISQPRAVKAAEKAARLLGLDKKEDRPAWQKEANARFSQYARSLRRRKPH